MTVVARDDFAPQAGPRLALSAQAESEWLTRIQVTEAAPQLEGRSVPTRCSQY